MKVIFNEEYTLPAFVDQWIDLRGRWDHIADAYVPCVDSRQRAHFIAHIIAHYDRETGALVVDLKTTLYNDIIWRPVDRKVLELHATRESALRRTIQIADDWYHEVEAAIPPEYTEDEILASYHAGQSLVKVLEGGD